MNNKRINHLFYTSVLAIVIFVIGGTAFCTYYTIKINQAANKDYVDDYFKGVFRLLGEHTATWDKYIQANEIEKEILWDQLDSIRTELNLKLTDKNHFRGPDTDNILFINTNL